MNLYSCMKEQLQEQNYVNKKQWDLSRLLRNTVFLLSIRTFNVGHFRNNFILRWLSSAALMMEAVSNSETSASFYETSRCNVLQDSPLHTRRRENLISHHFALFLIFNFFFWISDFHYGYSFNITYLDTENEIICSETWALSCFQIFLRLGLVPGLKFRSLYTSIQPASGPTAQIAPWPPPFLGFLITQN
jgi:hypothetical protein